MSESAYIVDAQLNIRAPKRLTRGSRASRGDAIELREQQQYTADRRQLVCDRMVRAAQHRWVT